jgi:dolichol-phosphate mannosyltransferase
VTSPPHALAAPPVSIIVPTFREAESLPFLIDRIDRLRQSQFKQLELIIVDDDSRDGTSELIAHRAQSWVRLFVRTEDRGLSQAVLFGLRQAQNEVLVVMDADLSHPPEVIPSMVEALTHGADFVIGSRYVSGGSTADDWGLLRWINSKVATLLARPLTSISDPMSGFFALTQETFARAEHPSPLGYKIGLELLVRCRCRHVRELPIHFSSREYGQSKLTLEQQLLYLRHLARLYAFKYAPGAALKRRRPLAPP